jgi:hypothetical protein
MRGEAILMLHNDKAAAAEFQKFIDHRGLVVNFDCKYRLRERASGKAFIET